MKRFYSQCLPIDLQRINLSSDLPKTTLGYHTPSLGPWLLALESMLPAVPSATSP